ncbi:hypothetical protein [Comamonas odontotermitis]|uniref:hypothetical protein n=1 Tax=Comamonas odontotermitis TaxID=379895 RepID=UPI0037518D89
MPYSQKMRCKPTYPLWSDSGNSGPHTGLKEAEAIEKKWELQVIHKKKRLLLLPTILLNLLKEKQKGSLAEFQDAENFTMQKESTDFTVLWIHGRWNRTADSALGSSTALTSIPISVENHVCVHTR